MKNQILILSILCFLSINLKAQAPTCACNKACTQTIDAISTDAITVNSGQVLCITDKGVVKGTINIARGGLVCNSGKISGNITIADDGTLNNLGIVDGNLTMGGYSNINNCGTMVVKNTPHDHVKIQGFHNGGCLMYYTDLKLWDYGTDTVWGKTFIDGDFEISSTHLVIAGHLEVKGELMLNDTRLDIMPGACIKVGTFADPWGGSVFGVGPGYSQVQLTGCPSACDASGNLFMGMLDICPKPSGGTFDPTVTFCKNNMNCTYTRCDELIGSCALTASAVPTQPTCTTGPNGQITATVSGGTGPYTYSWSNGQTTATITGVAPGTYTVTVSSVDGACSNKAVATLNPATGCACSIDATAIVTHPYCPENPFGTISVTPVGGVPAYTYQWSHGKTTATVTELRSGTYTVTVSDAEGRCVITKSYFINPAAISPLLVQGHDTLYAYPKQIGVTYLYQWFRNGNLIAGASLDYYVATLPGVYSVLVSTDLTSESACTGSSNEITIHTTGMVSKKEDNFNIKLIPNPNNGVFSIYFNVEKKSIIDIEIYDIMGNQILKTQKLINLHDKMDMDISGYSRGLYFLDVKDSQGIRDIIKVIHQ